MTQAQNTRSKTALNKIKRILAEFRHSLSYIDALPQLTFLGLIVGLLTGCIIVAFRFIVEMPLEFLLPGHTENFEGLGIIERSLMIMSGIGAIIILFQFLTPKDREMSVSHVIDRLHNHQAKLPFRNWAAQFVGSAISLGSGQSVGREGPVVHLGAGAASQFAQWLRLPNNSINILTGCGVSAAISASFDTPLAGVIFAMEVLALEYSIVGFVPVILASVVGTMVSQAALGSSVFIISGDTGLGSFKELPIVAVLGMVLAVCAGCYIRLNIFAMRMAKYPLIVRLVLAGVISVVAAAFIPEVMGQGYDTVNSALSGEIFVTTLLLIGFAKLCLTPLVIGLGVPGGLIGPMLVIGACIGGATGALVTFFFPTLNINPEFYVLVGMTGMMAATLNAPLTALVTVLELSVNPNTVFPSMLVIVVACVCTRQVFKVKGVFVEQLIHSKRPLDFGPAKQALRRAGVRSVMETRFTVTQQNISITFAEKLLSKRPVFLVITDEDNRYAYAMFAADLAHYLGNRSENAADNEAEKSLEKTNEKIIDLLEVPSRSYRISAVHETSTLYEAMQTFKTQSTQVLYVSGVSTPYSSDIKGILTLNAIENYYKPEEFRNAVD